MISFINLAVLFAAKVADNALSTTKTILVQRSRWILAGIAVIISDFIYFWITKRVVSANNEIAMLVVAVAGGVGYQLHLVPCHLGRVVHHLDAGVCARCDAREHMA